MQTDESEEEFKKASEDLDTAEAATIEAKQALDTAKTILAEAT